jgi:hypothetical protein
VDYEKSCSIVGSGENDEIAMGDTSSFAGRPAGLLEAIADGLEEIDSHFALEGITGIEDNAGEIETLLGDDQRAEDVSDESDDDPYDEPFYTAGFDREDVEIAIDEFLSHLLRKRLIRKDKSGRLPSFAGVFEKFFGPEHQIVRTAETFEEHIAGYFGWIDYENMREAYVKFLEIQTFITKELEPSRGTQNKGLFDTDHPRKD